MCDDENSAGESEEEMKKLDTKKLKDLIEKLPPNSYVDLGATYWCDTHKRKATHINSRVEACCDPKLGGIMMPCKTRKI